MYVHDSLAEIQTPSHWNLIGSSIADPSQAVLPSSILPPLSISMRSHSRKEKLGSFQTRYLLNFFFLKNLKR
jgi:hypothetical protein